MKRSLLLLATTLAFHASALAQTKVPSLINYQGYVANSAGVPIGNGAPENRTVTFRFWKSASDTAAVSRLYSESQTVTILDGDFSVLIGNGAAVDGETNAVATVAEVFSNKEVFLGITVDDGSPATTDAEISPRQQLVSTAFAFRASVAESVDSGAISNAMLDANAVNTDQLVASSVTNDKMAASSVNSANIVDGTITSFDIGTDAVGSDEIAANAVGTSEIGDGSIATIDIANDAITAAKIATNAVGSDEIAPDAVGASEIATDAVGAAEIAANAVGASEIATDAVAAAEIAANAVGTSELGNNSVTVDKLGSQTVRGEETLRIVRGTVTETGGWSAGGGFSPSRTGTGQYQVNFSTAFSSVPSVTANQFQGGADDNVVIIDTVTVNFFTLSIRDSTDTGLENQNFMFIAVGPVIP